MPDYDQIIDDWHDGKYPDDIELIDALKMTKEEFDKFIVTGEEPQNDM